MTRLVLIFTLVCFSACSSAIVEHQPVPGPSTLVQQVAVPTRIIVTNSTTITTYPETANGDVAPQTVIQGNRTHLNQDAGIAVQFGRIFLTDWQLNQVLRFKATDQGNASPRILKGDKTGLSYPFGIAVDATGIYVGNTGSINIFPIGATGNVAPVAVIAGPLTQLSNANLGDIALDTSHNIFVTDYFGNRVIEFAAGANGNVAPIRTIAGPDTRLSVPFGITVDGRGEIFVSSQNANEIVVFPPGASGNAKPIRYIQGDHTGMLLPTGIALDQHNRILFVANYENSITSYPADAQGDALPSTIIQGPHTGLSHPYGLSVAP